MNSIKLMVFYSCIFIFLLGCKKEGKTDKTSSDSSTVTSVKDSTSHDTRDTLQINNNVNIIQPVIGEAGEEYNPYAEYYVIANEVYVRSKPNKNSHKVKSLFFGDKVWSSYDESIKQYKKVYFTKPEINQPEPSSYYIVGNTLVDSYSFDEYRTSFSLEPFNQLHTGVKSLILSNKYTNNMNYELTQNKDRAKDVIAYGDFDSDGINDVAILIDNVENQSSRLLILCTNSATDQPYLAFAENYVDKLKVSSFKKGAKIFMEEDRLVPAPLDGIILTGEETKGVIIYDKNLQKFQTYGQLRGNYDY
ncbi:MAG: FG-GAP repeat protein [Weeksellaceae bacterium]